MFEFKQDLPVQLDALLVHIFDGHDVPLKQNISETLQVAAGTLTTPPITSGPTTESIISSSRLIFK